MDHIDSYRFRSELSAKMKNFLNGVIINRIIFQALSKEFLSERIVKFHREVTCFVPDHMIKQLLANLANR